MIILVFVCLLLRFLILFFITNIFNFFMTNIFNFSITNIFNFSITNFFNLFTIKCDAPRPWGINFQDSASPQMEALVELHDNIMFYFVIVLFVVAFILISIIGNYVYNNYNLIYRYVDTGTLMYYKLTIMPVLILIFTFSPALIYFFFPCFELLDFTQEVTFWNSFYDEYLVLCSDQSVVINGKIVAESSTPNVPLPFDATNSLGGQTLNIVHVKWNPDPNKGSNSIRFMYDTNDSTGKKLKELFADSNKDLVKRGDLMGIKIKQGTVNYDRANDAINPLVHTKTVETLTYNGDLILSRNMSAIKTVNPSSSPNMTVLQILGRDTQY